MEAYNDINGQRAVWRTCYSIYAAVLLWLSAHERQYQRLKSCLSSLPVAVVEIIPRSFAHSPEDTTAWRRTGWWWGRLCYYTLRLAEEQKDDDDTGWLGSQWDLISEDVYICRTTLFVAVVLSSRVSASLFAKQPQTSKMASPLLIFSCHEFRWYENVFMDESIAIFAIKWGYSDRGTRESYFLEKL